MPSRSFVRVEPSGRNARSHPLSLDENRQRRHGHRSRVPSRLWRVVQPDVERDDLSTAVSRQQCAALDAAKAESEISNDARGMLARCGIESARDIERGHVRALSMQFVDRRDGFGDVAARLSLETGAKDRVNDNSGTGADRARELHRTDGCFPLCYSIGRFCRCSLCHFDDGDVDTGAGEGARDDPAVASIVPGSCKDHGALPETFGIAP